MPIELHFDRLPALLPRYLRALAPRRNSSDIPVPEISAAVAPVTADPDHVNVFAQLVGYTPDGNLPPTYPQVVAAALHLSILTAPEFPFRASGLVHLANEIALQRPVPVTAAMELSARLIEPQRTSRGMEMIMHTAATVAGDPVWSSRSRFFARLPGSGRRERTKRSPESGLSEVASWHVPANVGRRYAAVSGDYNPIHLSALTARLFGFRRAIAHGMWSLGRTMAAMQQSLVPPYRLDVEFRRPLLLPAEVTLLAGDGRFRLNDSHTGKAYLGGFLA